MARPQSTVVITTVIMMVVSSSFCLQPAVAKTTHIVGDSLGWTIPPGGPATYPTWASKHAFRVGDTLVFNFTTGLHNVAEVSKLPANNDPCAATNTLSVNPTSPVTIPLTRPGTHHYICTVIGHCQIGQKLTINVSPATTATAPELSPSSAAATHPSGFEVSPAGSPFPLPLSAAPGVSAVVPVTFLAVALGFFY